MKVLFWSEGFWPHVGGIETFGEELILGLKSKGFEFAVVTSTLPNAPTEELYRDIPIYRLPMRQGLSQDPLAFKTTLQKIIHIKKEFRPDLHHFNVAGPSFFYHLQSFSAYPAKSIFTFHYLVPKTLSKHSLLTKMLEKSDWVTGASKTALEHARTFMPEIKSRSSHIYNGLTKAPLSATPLSEKGSYLLSWGRLVSNKGFDLMLKAFAKIAPYYPDLNCWLIGDGPEKATLQALIDKLGIRERTYFPGKHCSRLDLFKAIQGSRLVVIPSHDTTECFGLSALEAMQMGRPVITSKNPGLNEVVIDKKTGLLFEMNKLDSLVSAIECLLNDFNQSNKYAAAGKHAAEHVFTLEHMLDGYHHLFKTVLSEQVI